MDVDRGTTNSKLGAVAVHVLKNHRDSALPVLER